MLKRAADLVEALYGMQRNTPSLPPPRSPASMAAAMSGFNAAYAASAGQHEIDLNSHTNSEGWDKHEELGKGDTVVVQVKPNDTVVLLDQDNIQIMSIEPKANQTIETSYCGSSNSKEHNELDEIINKNFVDEINNADNIVEGNYSCDTKFIFNH